MLIDILSFGTNCNFTVESIAALEKAQETLSKSETAEKVFIQCRDQLFAESGNPWKQIDALSSSANIHRFTVHQMFLIYCAERTHEEYRQAGYPDNLYWDAMKDLKYKMEETYQVYGIWGVYCGPWLASFILMKSFCLGRLQFEILPSKFHYELAGYTLNPHNPVINIHIPSFGRLGYEDVLDAYSLAAKFFAHLFPDGGVWFHCETWMLYPPVNALLPAGNMKRFSEDFDIVHACIDPGQDDRYRVFMLPSHVPVSEYPEKNTLQRNLKAWLLGGNTMGVGVGLFLWKNGEVIPHG